MITDPTLERAKLLLAVNGEAVSSGDTGGIEARAAILAHLAENFGPLPPEADEYSSFETSDGIIRAEAFVAEGIDAWTVRYRLPDTLVPGRDWIQEVTSVQEDTQSLFSCRLSLAGMSEGEDLTLRTPDLLQTLCSEMVFQHRGFRLHPQPRRVGFDVSVTDTLRELTASQRWWDCIVLSEHAAIDPTALQGSLIGAANTFVLPEAAELEFSAAVGHDLGVPGQGLRVYRPGFDAMYSEITAHPATDAVAIAGFEDLQSTLVANAFATTAGRSDVRFKAPSFAMIRQMASRSLSEAVRASSDTAIRIAALESQIQSERRNTEEAVALAIQTDEERQSAQEALANEQAINHSLRLRIEALERQLAQGGSADQPPSPTEYGDIKRWITETHADALRLTTRAEKGLRNARYEKVSDVVAGLDLLAGPYRDMKRGICDPHQFEHAARSLGFEETRSVSKVSAGQHGDAYFVQYAGKRHFLDRHLKKGTAKDERHCLRIYFFWDAGSQMVIVGSLPGHLDV